MPRYTSKTIICLSDSQPFACLKVASQVVMLNGTWYWLQRLFGCSQPPAKFAKYVPDPERFLCKPPTLAKHLPGFACWPGSMLQENGKMSTPTAPDLRSSVFLQSIHPRQLCRLFTGTCDVQHLMSASINFLGFCSCRYLISVSAFCWKRTKHTPQHSREAPWDTVGQRCLRVTSFHWQLMYTLSVCPASFHVSCTW